MDTVFLKVLYNIFQRMLTAAEKNAGLVAFGFMLWVWALVLAVISVVVLLTSSVESDSTELARYLVTCFFFYTLAAVAVLMQFEPKE